MRRRLLRVLAGSALALVIAASLMGWWLQPPSAPEHLLFLNGDIVTMGPMGTAEALYSTNGRIVAVGTEVDVRLRAPADVHVIDLNGAALLPGFIEPHTHPLATAMASAAIDVRGTTHKSRADVMEALEDGVSGVPLAPWWVAFGWDPMAVPDLTPPTLEELDRISPERPLVVVTQMMHDAYINTAALRAAGITRQTSDPVGGAFLRDEHGEPNGIIHEVAAIKAVMAAMPPAPPAATELLLTQQFTRYARAGYTTIGVPGVVGRHADPVALVRRVTTAPSSPLRTTVYLLVEQLPGSGAKDDPDFQIAGVKVWMDGSPFTGGAAWREPYENSALVTERMGLPRDHMGVIQQDSVAFRDQFLSYHRAGHQVAVHVQGERAVDVALDAVAWAQARHPSTTSHRLEHNALITRDQLVRAKELGVTVGFFVDHIHYYGHVIADLVGDDRADRYMPVRDAFDVGLRPTLHGDHPATPVDAMRTLHTAVTRKRRDGLQEVAKDQAITVHQALLTLTLHAAEQLGRGQELGSLEVGKRADFVVLDRNPLDVAHDRLSHIQVRATWKDGEPVDHRQVTWDSVKLGLRALMGD